MRNTDVMIKFAWLEFDSDIKVCDVGEMCFEVTVY